MVIGYPHRVLAFTSVDIALRGFGIMGASNSIPANLRECVGLSQEHRIKPHVTYYHILEDIHEMIDLMSQGKVQGKFAI